MKRVPLEGVKYSKPLREVSKNIGISNHLLWKVDLWRGFRASTKRDGNVGGIISIFGKMGRRRRENGHFQRRLFAVRPKLRRLRICHSERRPVFPIGVVTWEQGSPGSKPKPKIVGDVSTYHFFFAIRNNDNEGCAPSNFKWVFGLDHVSFNDYFIQIVSLRWFK